MDRTTTKSETSSSSEEIEQAAKDALGERVESRRDKFVRLVNRRVPKAVKAIRMLTRMGGRNADNYDFTQADVDAISDVLRSELELLERSMVPTGIQLDIEFDLLNLGERPCP